MGRVARPSISGTIFVRGYLFEARRGRAPFGKNPPNRGRRWAACVVRLCERAGRNALFRDLRDAEAMKAAPSSRFGPNEFDQRNCTDEQ